MTKKTTETTVFLPVPSLKGLVQLEKEVIDFWNRENIYWKVRELRKDGPRFTWLEGPPTANGLPHIGHALTRAYKDAMLRYQTMKGKRVEPWTGGWDCHGLPVEVEVEKQQGISSKKDIIEFGIAKFNKLCKESVFKYEKEWHRMDERIGFWADMNHAYVTMKDTYIESVWWSLKQLFDKGLLYKGLRVAPYCPRCGTTLSSHEIGLGYKDVKDPAIYIKFKAKGMDNTYFLAWTTTPWTLISNVLLTVHPDYEYVLVEKDGEKYILVKDRVHAVFGEDLPAIQTFTGSELEGKPYEPLFSYLKDEVKKGYFVAVDTYVTTEDGTGIVHSAPAYGAEDWETGKRYEVTVLHPVKEDGTFDERITDFAGMWVKDADKAIIKKLRDEGKLFKEETYEHSYPHCWRCDTPLLYYGMDSWFIAMSKLRDLLLENNEKIRWQPEHIKHGRFGNFIANVIDWNLSRNRFWGTPLPVWVCDSCKHQEAIGSVSELKLKYGKELPNDFELHRPWVDDITWACEKCGKGTMKREPYVIDCWYDSGSAPFAQYHYPFENQERFNKDYPFDFIVEAIDQTRGWFYTLLAVATALFSAEPSPNNAMKNKPPYKNVLVLAHILNEDGSKMSKSRRSVSPMQIFENEGADALRWFLFSSTAWNPTRFSENLVSENMRKQINTLLNVYTFFVNNANADNFTPDSYYVPVDEREELDKWILSRLNNVAKEVNNAFENLAFHHGARAIEYFTIEELSNWWLRRSRRRFWQDEKDTNKKSAYSTLYEVLTGLAHLIAPYTPFLAESMYQNLVRRLNNNAPLSLFMNYLPEYDPSKSDEDLEKRMGLVLNVAIAGRAIRGKTNIKLRQPLQELIIVGSQEELRAIKEFANVLKEELNVKTVQFLENPDKLITYKAKPNFKVLAPKVKNLINHVKTELTEMDPNAIKMLKDTLETKGEADISIKGQTLTLTPEDVEIEVATAEGYETEQADSLQVFMSTTITNDLYQEGLARELVRRIQEMRRQANLAFTQKIKTWITGDEPLIQAGEQFKDYIKTETQSIQLKLGTKSRAKNTYKQEWEINKMKTTIVIQPQ